MNEKIKQLAEQATRNVESVNSYHSMVFDKEKFAELIVRECADLCNKFGDRLEDERPNKDLDIVAYECADGLKKHFGVER